MLPKVTFWPNLGRRIPAAVPDGKDTALDQHWGIRPRFSMQILLRICVSGACTRQLGLINTFLYLWYTLDLFQLYFHYALCYPSFIPSGNSPLVDSKRDLGVRRGMITPQGQGRVEGIPGKSRQSCCSPWLPAQPSSPRKVGIGMHRAVLGSAH